MEVAVSSLFAVYLTIYVITAALGVAPYVLQSLGMFAVAKRRRIENPWLAWIPVGNMWMLGCISDQFRYVTNGKDRKFRKLLLWLTVGIYMAMIPMFIMEFCMIFTVGVGTNSEALFIFAILTILLAVVVFAVSVFAMVIQYMAIYDYFCSCEPDNAVLYLVLSIVIPLIFPILFFAVRKKDLGMPPKQEEVPAE